MKFLLFSSVVSSLCGVIYAGQLIPQDDLSLSPHEDEERDLLFLPFDGTVESLELINAETNSKVITLVNEMVITSDNPSFSVNAIVKGKRIRSVNFEWTIESQGVLATVKRVEKTSPYALCANDGVDFFSCPNLSFGKHKLIVKACSRRNGRRCSVPIVINFTIERPAPTAPVAAPTAPVAAPTAPVAAPTAPLAAPTAPTAPKAPSAPVAPATPPVAPSAPVAPVTPPVAPLAPVAPATPPVAPVAPMAPVTPPVAPIAPMAPVTPPVAPVAPMAPVTPPVAPLAPMAPVTPPVAPLAPMAPAAAPV